MCRFVDTGLDCGGAPQFGKGGHEKSTESVKSDVQEYRITYECQGADNSAAATSGGENEI